MNFIIFLLIQHLFWCFNRQDLMSSGSVIYKPWNSEIVKFWNSVMRTFSSIYVNCFNPVQDGLFWGCSRMGEGGAKMPPLPKFFHTYPTIMKLGRIIPYQKKIQKIYESRDTLLEFCWHQHFFTWNQQILLYQ